ncbi:BQ5605_C003g02499 [Microbotryum silenes-dioicae]|uniref:BQ5605_C003g02499 protein n=1 Tax=Microbotryum silenes-dioicae TaxID=796604 RepID=A0A2X0MWA0_9BASI|nr:BQ5605_C003g02499 [Microbotryum silenes-dioicae]
MASKNVDATTTRGPLPFGLGREAHCSVSSCQQPGVPLPAPGSQLHDQVAQALSTLFSTFFATSLRYLGVSEILDWLHVNATVDAWLLTGFEQGRTPTEVVEELNLLVGRGAIKSVIVAALNQDDEAWATSLREVGFSSGMSMAYEGIISQLKYNKSSPMPCLHTLITPTGLAMLKSAPLKHAFPVCPPRERPSPQPLLNSIRSLIAAGALSGPAWKQASVWRPQVRRASAAYHAMCKDLAEEVVSDPSFSTEYNIFLDSISQPLQLLQLVAEDFEECFGPGACKGLLGVGDVGGQNLIQIMDFCAAKRPSELIARVKARVSEKQERERIATLLEKKRARRGEIIAEQLGWANEESATSRKEDERAETKRRSEQLKKERATLEAAIQTLVNREAELAVAREQERIARAAATEGLANGNIGAAAKALGLSVSSSATMSTNAEIAEPAKNKSEELTMRQGSSKDLLFSNVNDPFAATAPRAVSPSVQSAKGKAKAVPLLPSSRSPARYGPRGIAVPSLPQRAMSPVSSTKSTSRAASPVASLKQKHATAAASLHTPPPSPPRHGSPLRSRRQPYEPTYDDEGEEYEHHGEHGCAACAAALIDRTMGPVLAQRSLSASTNTSNASLHPIDEPLPPLERSQPIATATQKKLTKEEEIPVRPAPSHPPPAPASTTASVPVPAPVQKKVAADLAQSKPGRPQPDVGIKPLPVIADASVSKPSPKLAEPSPPPTQTPSTTRRTAAPIDTPAVMSSNSTGSGSKKKKKKKAASEDKTSLAKPLASVASFAQAQKSASILPKTDRLIAAMNKGMGLPMPKPPDTTQASTLPPYVDASAATVFADGCINLSRIVGSQRFIPKCCSLDRCTGDTPNFIVWDQLDMLLVEVCVSAFKYELIDNLAVPLEAVRDRFAKQYLLSGGKMADADADPLEMDDVMTQLADPKIGMASMWSSLQQEDVQAFTQRVLAVALHKLMDVFRAQLGEVCACRLSNHPEVLATAHQRLTECEQADRNEPIELGAMHQQTFIKWCHTQLREGKLSGPEWHGTERQYRVADFLFAWSDAFDTAIDRMISQQPYALADDLTTLMAQLGGVRLLDWALRLSRDGTTRAETDARMTMQEVVNIPEDKRSLKEWDRLIKLGVKQVIKGAELNAGVADEQKQLGNQHFAASEWAESLTCFATASLIDPTDSTYWTNTAAARLKIGGRAHFSEAVSDCTFALALDPGCVKALYRRGNALALLGLWDRAVADLTELVRVCPTDPSRQALAWVKARRAEQFARKK